MDVGRCVRLEPRIYWGTWNGVGTETGTTKKSGDVGTESVGRQF